MNLVIISGNLARDPKYKETSNGDLGVIFDIGVKDGRKDSDGDWVDKAIFIKVKGWGKVVTNMKKNKFVKGMGIVVNGKLDIRKWEDDDGNIRTEYYVKMNNWEYPTSPGKKKQDSDDEGASKKKKSDDMDEDLEDNEVDLEEVDIDEKPSKPVKKQKDEDELDEKPRKKEESKSTPKKKIEDDDLDFNDDDVQKSGDEDVVSAEELAMLESLSDE
jgi:single stranded DNA-binding protein